MNILFIEMEHQNLQFMKKLVEDGHTVYTQQHQNPNYLKSFGINSITDLPYFHLWTPEEIEYQTYNLNTAPKNTSEIFPKVLEKYKIDLVINTFPSFNKLIHEKDWGVEIITCSPDAIKLETEKLFARKFAYHCGMKLPKILQSGDNHTDLLLKDLPSKFIVKPQLRWIRAWVVPDKRIFDALANEHRLWKSPYPIEYFCEEFIEGLETNISYIMSDGKWSFTFSEHCDESNAKLAIKGEGPHAWYVNTTVEQLTPEVDKMVRDNVVDYLDSAAKLGGTYEGSITQMLGKDGKLYFLENNCRPYVQNTFPLPLGGNEYLDAFKNNPQKIGDCFTGKKFPKLVFQGKTAFRPNSECKYPFHLHDKYNIAEPTSVEIIDGEYIAQNGAVIIVFEDEINMDFVNEVEKESELKAYWGN